MVYTRFLSELHTRGLTALCTRWRQLNAEDTCDGTRDTHACLACLASAPLRPPRPLLRINTALPEPPVRACTPRARRCRYDGTVRNSAGDVVQFLYGEDGMDGVRIEGQVRARACACACACVYVCVWEGGGGVPCI
jgi:hypothetical protein